MKSDQKIIDLTFPHVFSFNQGLRDDTEISFTAPNAINKAKDTITSIWLENVYYTKIPEWVFDFTNLEDLSITGPNLRSISEAEMDKLVKLRNLQKLTIIGSRVDSLPAGIDKMTLLSELTISGGGFSHFPESIKNLEKLRKLRFSGKFTEFPPPLFDLVNLEELELFDSIPMDLSLSRSRLINLRKLTIHGRSVVELPDRFFPGKKMRELDLKSSRIEHLPKNLSGWPELESLLLLNSPVMELPDDIGKCKKLRKIDASMTYIRSLPESIGDCENLEELSLFRTQIDSLPRSLGQCKKLRLLDTQSTRIKGIPKELSHVSEIKARLRVLRNKY